MTTVVPERLLTIREVARRLAVSEKTIRRLVEAGRLPALRVGTAFASTPTSSSRGCLLRPSGPHPPGPNAAKTLSAATFTG
jgi:excisionase family DNA binding protein